MRSTARLLLALALVAPAALRAQLPGAPVLQNGFANPGITVAGNFATGENTSLGAVALAWSPGAGRFQFSAGVGRLGVEDQDPLTVYGARLGVPLLSFAGGRVGVAPFLGLGSGSRDSVRVTQLPVGVGGGYRMALGETRALSIYATATYLWSRTTVGDARTSDGQLRAAVAADVTVVRNLGLTLGYETGGEAGAGESGPSSPIFGAGLSWAFR